MRKSKIVYCLLPLLIVFSCNNVNKKQIIIQDTKVDSVSISESTKGVLESEKLKNKKVTIKNPIKARPKVNSYPKATSYPKSTELLDSSHVPVVDMNQISIPPNNNIDQVKTITLKSIKRDTIDIDVKLGMLLYHIPDTMLREKTYTIKVRINRDTSNKIISHDLKKYNKLTVIKTTSKMEVNIVDPSNESFRIVKSNSDQQLVEDEYTEWIYDVTPIKNGHLKLNLVVSIIRDENKKQIVYFDTVFVKLNPKATMSDFISENWKWLCTTILIPLLTWWWNKKRKNKKKV